MGKMKVHELAKELNLSSKELLEKIKSIGIEAKSHMSSLEENDVEKIRKAFTNNKKEADKNKENKKNSTKKQAETKQAPIIIRRELIVEEHKEEKKEAIDKNDLHRKNMNSSNLVKRNNRNDFNTAPRRNKPEKPMTVSELFGLNKKEEKKEIKKEEIKKEETKQEVKKVKEVKAEEQPKQEISSQEVKKTSNNESNVNKNRRNDRYQDGNNRPNNRFNNQNRDNNYNNDRRNNNRNDFGNRRPNNNFRNNNNNNNRFNNSQNGNGYQRNNNGQNNGYNRFNKRPLDERGIEKNIKDIMTNDIPEKDNSREFSRAIDRQKNNDKFNDSRNTKKKARRDNGNNYEINEGKLKSLKQHDRLSNMFDDQDNSMLDYYDLTTERGRKGKKKNIKNDENRTKQKIFKLTDIVIPESISVKDLAVELKKTSGEVIMKLMNLGVMATLNNMLDFDTAFLVASEFGVTATKKEEIKEEDILFDESEDKESELVTRPPVVVVMGHVDHGKTSLLDTIRKTNVIGGEAGGITQAIGAYQVKINNREITFLDTPGHEAFTAMRARGAQITDIAILVVAANDGVMPQTVEAINHAKSAGIPIIVAVNKIDLPDANVEKVKEELMQYELVSEEWGGDTIFVPISAKKNINIDQLLEMVLLQADVLELKANPHKQAKGVVIEARLDKNKGAIASMLVQRGTLDVGDTVVVGSTIGRIRSMINDKGKKVKSAGPSMPVEIMGLTEVPQAGDIFYEVSDEKMAKHLIERRKRQEREKSINQVSSVTLDNLFNQMEQGKLKQLNLIVKADVQGSVEALKQSLEKLTNEEVKVKVIHAAAGAVTESDVTLAKVSNAIIIAFNVRPVATAKSVAEKDEVQIKQYSIIYQAIDDVEAAMKGMLDPEFEEEVIGTAEVRQVFKISSVGTIAGAMVLSGKVARNAGVRVIRDDVVIHEGKLASLKRFKDDAKEVAKDFECGIQIEKYNDLKEGDIIEAFVMKEIKR